MNWIKKGPIAILITVLLLTSCNLPSEETAKATQTALFETVVAGITQTMAAKPTDTATMQPSLTLPVIPPTANPINTIAPPPMSTVAVTPCNRATFVSDVTVPDGTVIAPGSSFKKTWRLQNSGTCTWTSGYTVVYVAGERMGAPESEVITTSSVAPGQSVDVSVTLTAPAAVGSYTAYFRLRSADGVQFGVLTNASGTFYVQIKVTGGTATATGTVTGAPTITGLNPTYALANSTDTQLTVFGTNFGSGSVVKWGSTSLTTTYVSATQLTAKILQEYIKTVGNYSITVVNSNGTASSQATFYVKADNPAPTLNSINPNSVNAGNPEFTMNLYGLNFKNGATAYWQGTPLTTYYGDASYISAVVPASLLTTAGTYNVTVVNPSPGGGTSGAVGFTVNAVGNPAPTITQLIPASATNGSADTPLQVIGPGNFVSGATISLNGTAVATTYIGTGELRATIPAALLSTAGVNVTVTVTNPAPGGGATSATFTVN